MPRRRAPQGSGGVGYDRTARSYYARIHTRDATGKRVAHKVRAPTEDAAIEALRGLRARYGVDAASDEPMGTLSEYLDAWLSSHERTLRPATRASYRSHVTLHIDPLLGGIPLHRLRPSDVDRLIARLVAKDMAPTSVARVVATLRIALGRAVRRRLITHNPAARAPLPRVERHLVEPMTDAQADRIVEALAGDPEADPPVPRHWLLPIVRVMLGTGLRVGEACGLDWRDVHEGTDDDPGYVVVRVSKTRQRVQPLTPDAADALRSLRAARTLVSERVPVFTMPSGRRRGERLLVQSVSHALPVALEERGLPRVTPHQLRHGYATRLVAHGVHMRLVGELLGHADGGALAARTYAHVVPEHLATAVRSLDRKASGSIRGS